MPPKKCYLASCLLLATVSIAQNVPKSSHVWMVTEENHSYEDVVGNAKMPYYNHLIQQYGLATQFYANQHSSLPALMWLVAGAPVEPNNDTISCDHQEDNIVRELLNRGYTWRSYQANMPIAGFQGLFGGKNRSYYRRHNPLIDFTDVCPGTGQEDNSVPYTQLAKDFAQGKSVNYNYIAPDSDEDAHNGSLAIADQWLQNNIPTILSRPEFAPGGDGILFIVWDEGTLYTDNRCSATVRRGCGGRTATLVIGPQVKSGYQSTITYHNENVLSTVCAAMGLSPCPGAANTAATMADFFNADNAPVDQPSGIIISTPGDGAILNGAVHLIAKASESQPVSEMQVWDNGVKLGNYYSEQIDDKYDMAVGQHTLTALDLDSSYNVINKSSITYDVQQQTVGLQIVSPTSNQVINMPTVHVVAHANESVPISQIQVWDNGERLGTYSGADVNQYFSLSQGSHIVSIMDLDGNFNVLHQSSVSYSLQ